jgi:hypothetical protein
MYLELLTTVVSLVTAVISLANARRPKRAGDSPLNLNFIAPSNGKVIRGVTIPIALATEGLDLSPVVDALIKNRSIANTLIATPSPESSSAEQDTRAAQQQTRAAKPKPLAVTIGALGHISERQWSQALTEVGFKNFSRGITANGREVIAFVPGESSSTRSVRVELQNSAATGSLIVVVGNSNEYAEWLTTLVSLVIAAVHASHPVGRKLDRELPINLNVVVPSTGKVIDELTLSVGPLTEKVGLATSVDRLLRSSSSVDAVPDENLNEGVVPVRGTSFIEDIRLAIHENRLSPRFRPADVRRACPGWAENTYAKYLPKHRLGNPGGYVAYFQRFGDGSYGLLGT